MFFHSLKPCCVLVRLGCCLRMHSWVSTSHGSHPYSLNCLFTVVLCSVTLFGLESSLEWVSPSGLCCHSMIADSCLLGLLSTPVSPSCFLVPVRNIFPPSLVCLLPVFLVVCTAYPRDDRALRFTWAFGKVTVFTLRKQAGLSYGLVPSSPL